MELMELLKSGGYSVHTLTCLNGHEDLSAWRNFALHETDGHPVNVARGGIVDEQALADTRRRKISAGPWLRCILAGTVPAGNPCSNKDRTAAALSSTMHGRRKSPSTTSYRQS